MPRPKRGLEKSVKNEMQLKQCKKAKAPQRKRKRKPNEGQSQHNSIECSELEVAQLLSHSLVSMGKFKTMQFKLRFHDGWPDSTDNECRVEPIETILNYWRDKFDINENGEGVNKDQQKFANMQYVLCAMKNEISIPGIHYAIHDAEFVEKNAEVIENIMPWAGKLESYEDIKRQFAVEEHKFRTYIINPLVLLAVRRSSMRHLYEMRYYYPTDRENRGRENAIGAVPTFNKFSFEIEWPNIEIVDPTIEEEDEEKLYQVFEEDEDDLMGPPDLLFREQDGSDANLGDPQHLQLTLDDSRWQATSELNRYYDLDIVLPAGMIICTLGGKVVPISIARDLYRTLGEFSRRFFVALPLECGISETHVLDRTDKMDYSTFMTHSCNPNCEVVWKKYPDNDERIKKQNEKARWPWYAEVRTTRAIKNNCVFTLDWFVGQQSKGDRKEQLSLLNKHIDFLKCTCQEDNCREILFCENMLDDDEQLGKLSKKERLKKCDLSNYHGSVLHLEMDIIE